MWIVLNNTVEEILEADRADQSQGLFVFIIGYIQYCILSFTVDKEKAAVSNSSTDSSSNNRSSFALTTKWLIWMTTKHQMGSFPPLPAGPGRAVGQILIRHCVLLWTHHSRCFSLAGCAAVFILNCSVIRSRSKAWGCTECCEGERERRCFFVSQASGPKGTGANKEGAESHVSVHAQSYSRVKV